MICLHNLPQIANATGLTQFRRIVKGASAMRKTAKRKHHEFHEEQLLAALRRFGARAWSIGDWSIGDWSIGDWSIGDRSKAIGAQSDMTRTSRHRWSWPMPRIRRTRAVITVEKMSAF
jgi:hypothetical protein